MSNNYRIRTQVGVDKYINVQLDQDFEFLEILSLKILQSQIYIRPCSDYGVVVGRISVNNGFGIPNAKVSIFIPLTSEDENDPIIADLYPYKTLNNTNDDGYRYNLLPYTQSYSNHTPTGTFPTRKDVLTNPYLIEVFDKYFKYTCTTNDSGDFMIFGVPLGSQTIHVDIDLSDIGEFSLSPQDLIRMGIATESQVAGTKFKSSTNLGELPQLIQFNRVIDVQPLWGEPEICNLGITRTDFDLSTEANINITPTAIFMGSLISSNEDQAQKANCKPRLKQGGLCNLVVGPGQILAIRQTIRQDLYGRPGLEVFELESGGQLIDDNGTWMFDVPMNMDRLVTNEFGQQVISSDPKAGIPTSAKYRFKIKWNQSPSLKEPIKRGYFLVPNIKEYGWTNSSGPDPINSLGSASINQDFLKSYAFSVDWNDYGNTGTTVGQQMIQEAISAEDRFYYMEYNKVYTVSQLISQYRNGYASNRIISLKNDLDDVCESENNKFPTNDANFRFDIIYLLALFMSYVFRPVLLNLLLLVHILAFFLMLIGPILAIIVGIVFLFVILGCKLIELLVKGINKLGFSVTCGVCPCPTIADLKQTVKTILNLYKKFTNISVPELTYPDCDLCACNEDQPVKDDASTNPATAGANQSIQESGVNSVLSQYPIQTNYNYVQPNDDIKNLIESFFGGLGVSSSTPTAKSRAPQGGFLGPASDGIYLFTTSLTLAERINLFNTKAKYFDDGPINPGGGVNRIKSTFNYPLNNPITKYHYDNVIVMSLDDSQLTNFPAGKLVSFVDPTKSKDVNMTGVTSLNAYGTTSITGTSVGTIIGSGQNAYVQTIVPISYANPSPPYNLLSVVGGGYTITGKTEDSEFQRFPMDIEYFQVITAMTYSSFTTLTNSSASNSTLNKRFLGNTMRGYWLNFNKNCGLSIIQLLCCLDWSKTDSIWMTNTPYIQNYVDYDKQVIVFLVRGVDPHSTENPNEYDLSYLFGYSSWGQRVVRGNYKMNIPIQTPLIGGNIKAGSHITNGFLHINNDTYAGIPLYYPSFQFQPATGTGLGKFSGFTSDLPRFYSNLENNGLSTNVVIQPSGLPRGLVLSNINLATIEYMTITPAPTGFCTGKSTPLVIQPNTTTGLNDIDNKPLNKGYYQNEIVDGGSVIYYENTPFSFVYSQPNNTTFEFRGYEFSYVYPPTYNLGFTSLGSSGRQIVMRSDRLFSSDVETFNGGRSYLLQNNLNTAIYLLDNQGNVSTIGGSSNVPSNSPAGENTSPTGALNAVFDSFSCGGMVPLGCYDTNSSGQIIIKPTTDSCYTNNAPNKQKIMKNGCYIFVTQIFLSLPKDISLVFEWLNRFMIIFGACRNVWSHLFTNNWINGTLYAFSLNNNRFYTSPTATPPNRPFSEFCRETLILHPTTNNFYYRSSPYNPLTNDFIGRVTAQGTYGPQVFGSYGGNVKFLGFPTTMLDMGPKTYYIQELVMSDKYDGFVVNKMAGTTFQDVAEILNLFIMTRLANTSFLGSLLGIGGASITSYFSRPKSMVDGDYAQMISINSELSTNAFQAENYSSATSVFLNGGKASDAIFGIFYSADNQTRDYISPKRTILNPNLPITNNCSFNNFGTYSQIVPFYEWEIKQNSSTNPGPPNPDSIFGSQKNDWYTNVINNGLTSTGFHKYKYQSLDRLNISSRYFMTTNVSKSNYFKGLIYSVNSSGVESPNLTNWSRPSGTNNVILVGAPFQFYFGLKKGKTAFDRFAKTYLDFENIIDE